MEYIVGSECLMSLFNSNNLHTKEVINHVNSTATVVNWTDYDVEGDVNRRGEGGEETIVKKDPLYD